MRFRKSSLSSPQLLKIKHAFIFISFCETISFPLPNIHIYLPLLSFNFMAAFFINNCLYTYMPICSIWTYDVLNKREIIPGAGNLG